MKSDEYMSNVDAALDIDGMNYDRILELKTTVMNAEIDYFMIDILRAAHRAIIDNDITTLEDYQSDKAVLPANAAKARIANLIKIYPERFSIKNKEEFDSVRIEVLALSGGPEGLYLIADVIVNSEISRWMYPPKLPANPDAEEPDGKVRISIKCYGADCLSSSSDSEVFTIKEGSSFTTVFIPHTDCVFAKITINDQEFTSIKDVTSIESMSLAESNQGYKLILQNVTEDTNIVFECRYDVNIKTFRVDGDLIGCTPNCELPIIVNEGSSVHVTLTGRKDYILNQLIIDGIDYTGLCKQGVTEFSHGKLTDTKDDDYNVNIIENSISIKFDALGCDHNIVCHYIIPSFMIVGTGEHVTIEPNPAEVFMLQDRVITITPDDGYEVSSVECAVPFTEELATNHTMVITFENVTQDINYIVSVTKKGTGTDDEPNPPVTPEDVYYTITGYGDNVTMSENPISLKEGGNTIIKITPNSGYKITGVNTDYPHASLVQSDDEAFLQISDIDSDVIYTVRTAPITTPEDPDTPDNPTPDNPDPEKTYYTVTTNIGAVASNNHNIIVTSPELTENAGKYTFDAEKDTAVTMNLTSGYMDGNEYLTKMNWITITATDTSTTILTSDVNVGESGTITTTLEDTSGDIIGSIEATASENTYTYTVTINKITQNLTIAFGTTNVNIGQGSKT